MVVVAPVVTAVGRAVAQRLYITVGLIWLTWMGCGREGDDLRVLRNQRLDRYQFGSMVCALIFLDNVLRKMGGPGESVWWWLASGRNEVILLSGGAMLTCQFLFWSGIVEGGDTRKADESGPRRR